MVSGADAVSRWKEGVGRARTEGIARAADVATQCSAQAKNAGSVSARIMAQLNCVREGFGKPALS